MSLFASSSPDRCAVLSEGVGVVVEEGRGVGGIEPPPAWCLLFTSCMLIAAAPVATVMLLSLLALPYTSELKDCDVTREGEEVDMVANVDQVTGGLLGGTGGGFFVGLGDVLDVPLLFTISSKLSLLSRSLRGGGAGLAVRGGGGWTWLGVACWCTTAASCGDTGELAGGGGGE